MVVVIIAIFPADWVKILLNDFSPFVVTINNFGGFMKL